MTKPTVGRVVYYRTSTNDTFHHDEPLAAIVCGVVEDGRRVNLAVFDQQGRVNNVQLVRFEQEESKEANHTSYAHWMPYQAGQAKKAEDLQATTDEKIRAAVATETRRLKDDLADAFHAVHKNHAALEERFGELVAEQHRVISGAQTRTSQPGGTSGESQSQAEGQEQGQAETEGRDEALRQQEVLSEETKLKPKHRGR